MEVFFTETTDLLSLEAARLSPRRSTKPETYGRLAQAIDLKYPPIISEHHSLRLGHHYHCNEILPLKFTS
jgi:hypothetical protein